ncbi:glycosyl transferase family 1 [Intrasporangium oryzae NRRL B-24470]|uniref:Glycosyl transferase family 1 n=1 Tax=Intrasporangium oryzae NRRL B-24470 TaxID=1386089 RepID=W9GD77_9MICO|nr:glycosyltransferase family 4 protein [Intrasporangium oryzae]EWT02788.1 glycosyl transferase family 1 [Intrasporangium oryzae NRRL B-24470]
MPAAERTVLVTPPSAADGRPVRVAVLDHTAELGGAELALIRLLDHVDRRRFEVVVVLFSDGPLAGRLRDAGHAVEVLPLGRDVTGVDRHTAGGLQGIVSAARSLPFVARLARRLRALDVDLVHTTSLKADLLGVPAAGLARRPLVWHVHDRIAPDYLPAPLVGLVRRAARRLPRHVIANSAATAATLPGVRRLSVAHPGLTPEQVAPAPRQAQPEGPPVVGIVGRISPTKDQLTFVRAAAAVAASVPAARFRVVGEPSFGAEAYAAEVADEVRRLGLDDRLTFTGFVSEVADELDALAVCVHAAAVPEPFGQVVTEAMARGVPVVATRGGGVTEILDDGGPPLGWLVPPGDPAALAEAVTQALSNPEEARARAAAAWHSATERFDIERTAGTVMAVWEEVATP